MARTWLSVRVELLGGRGEDLWPCPGRVLVVGPSHTFAHLAKAIDNAFARWDRGHLCQFTLADGILVTDEESADEEQGVPFGPLPTRPLVLERSKVTQQVRLGEPFRYVFDFGDNWTYACTVGEAKVDPADELGMVPREPTVVWGWGTIPDQYGRRFDGDDRETPLPRRPAALHPMLAGRWPASSPAMPVDVKEFRSATYRRDVPAILAAIEGREIDDLLQAVGLATQVVLAADLLAGLRDTPIAARHLPVDLLDLGSALGGDPVEPAGYLDLSTGEVLPALLTDPAYVGEDSFVDVDEDPDRWLELGPRDPRPQWQDMADFAARQTNTDLRRRLESAIEGKGAFRRFRDVVHDEDLVAQWLPFADDRQMGRARAFLAEAGIRPVA